ncbi:MAG: serine/threonine protein kinase, partial [Lentisphaeria bacterium]|nr:serine/threonine protein kinase [Lentisphaeria bacterium]
MSFASSRNLEPGTRVAGYEVEREVGRGAMAIVYRAIQLNLRRPVALKILSDELASSEEFVVRFFNEARAAAALSHAHIVQAYDAGVTEGSIYYFAMEFVEGETLLQRIQRQGYVRPGPGLQLAVDIADALNYGWQRQKLTHGDIKPENIMINTAGETKLADFGLAKVGEHDCAGPDILLTPLYAAPEVIRGQQQKGDCRSDIYAFGATLYHMFGGSPPFPGDRAQEVMQRHLTEPLEPLRERNSAVPGMISDLVGRMLSKEVDRRPSSWEEVLRELQILSKRISNPSVVTRPVLHAVPVRRARVAGGGARRARPKGNWIALFVLIAIGGI